MCPSRGVGKKGIDQEEPSTSDVSVTPLKPSLALITPPVIRTVSPVVVGVVVVGFVDPESPVHPSSAGSGGPATPLHVLAKEEKHWQMFSSRLNTKKGNSSMAHRFEHVVGLFISPGRISPSGLESMVQSSSRKSSQLLDSSRTASRHISRRLSPSGLKVGPPKS